MVILCTATKMLTFVFMRRLLTKQPYAMAVPDDRCSPLSGRFFLCIGRDGGIRPVMVASPKTAKKTVDEKHRFLSHSAHFEKGSFSVRDDEGEWICYNEDKVIDAGMRDGGTLEAFSEWASVKKCYEKPTQAIPASPDVLRFALEPPSKGATGTKRRQSNSQPCRD